MLNLLLSYVMLVVTQHLTGSKTRSMSFIIKVLKWSFKYHYKEVLCNGSLTSLCHETPGERSLRLQIISNYIIAWWWRNMTKVFKCDFSECFGCWMPTHSLMPMAWFSKVLAMGNCSFQRLRKEDTVIEYKFTLHGVAQSVFRATTKQTPARLLGRSICCITEVPLDV